MAKRIQKTKPEIVQDFKKIEAAKRMREVVRKDIYPFLLELNDTIGYTKIFMQTCSTTVDSVYTDRQKTTKISELLPRINEIFTTKDETQKPVYEKYRRLFEILKDESIYDFNTMIQTFPRAIETYYTQQNDKRTILELDIEHILG